MDDTPVEPALPDASLAVAAAAPTPQAVDLQKAADNLAAAGAIYQNLASKARGQNDTSKAQDFSDTSDFLLDASEYLRSIAGLVVVES